MPSERKSKGFFVNLDFVKTLLDVSVKLIPVVASILTFLIQFLVNQGHSLDRAKQDDERIKRLETDLNEKNRSLVEEKINNAVLKQQLEDQEKFYLLTRGRR